MSELILTLSERFSAEDAASIRADLRQHLQVGNPQFIWRRSVDPISTLVLLGAAAAWKVLVKPAEAFLTGYAGTLGKKFAEATWERIAARKKTDELKPLVDVVAALVEAAGRVGGEVKIGVGINVPDDHFGTVIWTDSRDPIDVARSLSAFVVRAERIFATVRAEIERGNEPLGPFLMELERDGGIAIRWRRRSDAQAHEVRIP